LNAELIDNHIHTELAYCSEKMTAEKPIARARGLVFDRRRPAQHHIARLTDWDRDVRNLA